MQPQPKNLTDATAQHLVHSAISIEKHQKTSNSTLFPEVLLKSADLQSDQLRFPYTRKATFSQRENGFICRLSAGGLLSASGRTNQEKDRFVPPALFVKFRV
jgi:hypothetical protein